MSTTPLKPPGNSSSRSNSGTGNNNFAKALLEAGGHTVQGSVDAGVQFAGDALSSLFGAAPVPQAHNKIKTITAKIVRNRLNHNMP